MYRYLLVIVICSAFSCKSKADYKYENKQSEIQSEKFNVFYDAFMTDSSFQLSRIKFPLHGEYVDWETTGIDEKGNDSSVDFIWTKENWNILHKMSKEDLKDYDFKTNTHGSKVTKIISGKGFGFYLEQQFELIENKWYLVYFIERDL